MLIGVPPLHTLVTRLRNLSRFHAIATHPAKAKLRYKKKIASDVVPLRVRRARQSQLFSSRPRGEKPQQLHPPSKEKQPKCIYKYDYA